MVRGSNAKNRPKSLIRQAQAIVATVQQHKGKPSVVRYERHRIGMHPEFNQASGGVATGEKWLYRNCQASLQSLIRISNFLGEPAMKKSLIALAVLGLSGAAMAQSSVTLYGVADAGVGRLKVGVSADPAKVGNDASGKTEFTSGSLMNNGTSRLGVRGTEDLGGGLKAGFQFETGLDLDNGAAGTKTGSGADAFWARQANVWLGGNWGTVKLGRQFTPSYLTTASYELTGVANYSVLANTYNYAGIGSRANSAFAYVTPNFGGFTGALAYVTKNDLGLSKAAYDLGLMYSNGPIGAGVSINKVANSKTNYQAGAKYSFGNFAVAASYTQASNQAKAVRRGFGVGAGANFGAFSVTVDLTRDIKNEWTGKKYTNGVVEAKYALSKRTFVYGAFLRLDSTNNYGIGVRHNF
ncbi:porin [Ottowia testudinis]|uniref:Porin n=1 Tax=Ottowia testudinis TaxID=2816950 RepID=A0A975H6Q0_9BURK|nr:porin [Ottowia testudinis]QTD46232.1 porin [Ottowia testudinis]